MMSVIFDFRHTLNKYFVWELYKVILALDNFFLKYERAGVNQIDSATPPALLEENYSKKNQHY